jgi:hypothetical protein
MVEQASLFQNGKNTTLTKYQLGEAVVYNPTERRILGKDPSLLENNRLGW